MKLNRLLAFGLGIAAAFTLTVALVVMVMRPPLNDVMQLALLFAVTASASALVGFLSHRLGWWRRLPRLNQTLTLGYAVAAGLTLLNVWLTARMMFINAHDLTLAGLLLLFAGGISISFGYFLSDSLSSALREVVRGTAALSEGRLDTRVQVGGRDEVAQLAQAFNAMAERLELADREARTHDAARREFVAWASHDLRTPLASLRAMLEAVADGVVSDPDTVARYLRQCQSEVGRMSALIDDLFELTQLDAGGPALRFEASSLSDLISDTLEGFAARAEARGLHLSGSVAPGVDPVWMAPEKMSRVLRNLLANAIRHTPAGGQITLTAETQGESVALMVSDTGEGIAPEDLPRVFERFYRAEKSRSREGYSDEPGGAGLGLAIVRELVEAHGGRIEARSAPGRGTTMVITLPRQAM